MDDDVNYGAIIEGRCPTCAEPLERREKDGWCPTCEVGWAYHTSPILGETVSMTIDLDLTRWSTATAGFVGDGNQ